MDLALSKIERLRETRTANIRKEWVIEENQWRSCFRFIGVRPVTEEDFNPDNLTVHQRFSEKPRAFRPGIAYQRFWYYSMGHTLYKGDEDIIYRVMCAASLSLESGNGMIWLSSEESQKLQDWRLINLDDFED